jgi:sporulation protein YlmC with PRC-barrel domain
MAANEPIRVGALLGRHVRDAAGRDIGRITDLETQRDGYGRERVVAAMVSAGLWGRLFGYGREEVDGPWLLEVAAARLLRRHNRRVPWEELRLDG